MAARSIPLADKNGPLKREEVQCPICWSILIEPVTLPCKHILCLDCFKKHVAETSLQCPCCRMRLSVWSRRAFRENNLVDSKLWERIKKEFPKLVEARMCGEDSQSLMPEDLLSVEDRRKPPAYSDPPVSINELQSTPRMFDGEIITNKGDMKRELEELIRKHQEDIENQRRTEERASADLIRQMQETGELMPMLDPKVVESDLRLARKIEEEEKKARLAEITSRRKLFTEPESSDLKNNLPESSQTKIKSTLISGWTNSPNVSCKAYTPRNSSSSNINHVVETPKSSRGKRPSHSTLASRCSKKQKRCKGNISSASSSRSSLPSQKGSSQSHSSRNSILTYMSCSQTMLDETSCSQSFLPDPPVPCKAAFVRLGQRNEVRNSFDTGLKTTTKASSSATATVTSAESEIDATSSLSAFSPTKSIRSKIIPGQVYQNHSVENPLPYWTGNQLIISVNNNNDQTSAKMSERDTPTPNSIDLEISSHFRPIRSAPKTPPKRLPNGSFLPEPIVVKTTPRKIITPVFQVKTAAPNPVTIQATANNGVIKPNKIPCFLESGKRISDDSGRASVSSMGSVSETVSDSDSSGCVIISGTDHVSNNNMDTKSTGNNISIPSINKDDISGRVSPVIPTLLPISSLPAQPSPVSMTKILNRSCSSTTPPPPDISMYGPCNSPAASASSVNSIAVKGTESATGKTKEDNDSDDLTWLADLNTREPGSPSSQDSYMIDLEEKKRQEEEFERLRLKRLQEEQDRKFAERLQKQMNKGHTPRDNPYGLRSWLRKSSSNSNTPSSSK